jgi:hypothetical protein
MNIYDAFEFLTLIYSSTCDVLLDVEPILVN